MLPRPFRTSTNTSKNIPLPKSKRTKIDVINEDNKENIYLKNLKLTTSSRQFGKELNLIQKRNSFAHKKENNKINMFIKKIPSASQLNSKPNTSSNNRVNTSKTKTSRIIVGNNSFGNLRKSANLITSNKHIQSNSFAKKDVKSNTMSISQKKYFNNNLINGVNNTKPFSHIPSASTLITKSNSLSQLNKQKQYSNNIDIVSPQSTKQTYNINNKQQKKQDEQQPQKDKQHSKDKHSSIDSPNINNNNSNNLNKTNDQQQLSDKTYHYFQIANNKQLNNPQIPYEYINTILNKSLYIMNCNYNTLTRSEKELMNGMKTYQKKITYKDLFNIILGYHIKSRDVFLKPFKTCFKKINTEHNGILTKMQFYALIISLNIFDNDTQLDNNIDTLIMKLPHCEAYDTFTFSEVVDLLENTTSPKVNTFNILEYIASTNSSSNKNNNNYYYV